jgi:hypothetical protein
MVYFRENRQKDIAGWFMRFGEATMGTKICISLQRKRA